MKYFLLFVILLPLTAQAQCEAFAGPDKHVCNGPWGIDTIQLGDNPAVLGGNGPYTYTWSTNYSYTSGSFTYQYSASDLPNDTTLPNPSVVYAVPGPVTFTLTVTDSIGNMCSDSVTATFSNFVIHLGNMTFYINQGDSIYLNYGSNVGGGTPPVEYLWQPTHGLTDSTSLAFWAKPAITTNYYVTVTDSGGCSLTGGIMYIINVSSSALDEQGAVQGVSVFHDPYQEQLSITVEDPTSGWELNLYNALGQGVKMLRAAERDLTIDLSELPQGIFVYSISNEKAIIARGKMIIQ